MAKGAALADPRDITHSLALRREARREETDKQIKPWGQPHPVAQGGCTGRSSRHCSLWQCQGVAALPETQKTPLMVRTPKSQGKHKGKNGKNGKHWITGTPAQKASQEYPPGFCKAVAGMLLEVKGQGFKPGNR